MRTPPGWLADWKEQPVEFPRFAIVGASHDEGAIAVQARDDMTVRPDKLNRLVPLAESEQAKYGLANVLHQPGLSIRESAVCGRPDGPADRAAADARTFSCFQVKPEGLAAHYELLYHVDEARARRLALYSPRTRPRRWPLRALAARG